MSWRLLDGKGTFISDLKTLLELDSVYNGPVPSGGKCVASADGTKEVIFKQPVGSTGNSSFRIVSSGYQFNWDSTTTITVPTITPAGCYSVLIMLNDTSPPKVMGPIELTN